MRKLIAVICFHVEFFSDCLFYVFLCLLILIKNKIGMNQRQARTYTAYIHTERNREKKKKAHTSKIIEIYFFSLRLLRIIIYNNLIIIKCHFLNVCVILSMKKEE
jgi:hypothetical protein